MGFKSSLNSLISLSGPDYLHVDLPAILLGHHRRIICLNVECKKNVKITKAENVTYTQAPPGPLCMTVVN